MDLMFFDLVDRVSQITSKEYRYKKMKSKTKHCYQPSLEIHAYIDYIGTIYEDNEMLFDGKHEIENHMLVWVDRFVCSVYLYWRRKVK